MSISQKYTVSQRVGSTAACSSMCALTSSIWGKETAVIWSLLKILQSTRNLRSFLAVFKSQWKQATTRIPTQISYTVWEQKEHNSDSHGENTTVEVGSSRPFEQSPLMQCWRQHHFFLKHTMCVSSCNSGTSLVSCLRRGILSDSMLSLQNLQHWTRSDLSQGLARTQFHQENLCSSCCFLYVLVLDLDSERSSVVS